MILRHFLLRRPFIQDCFKISNKLPYSALCKQTNKSKHKAIAVATFANFSLCNISREFNQETKLIVGSQSYEISKGFHSSNHIKSKLRKDDDLQPELKEVPLTEGVFDLSPTHFDREIQDKDIGRKFTVGENVITALNNVYGIDRRMALTILNSPKFLHIADSTILQTIYFLAKRNISAGQIQRIPWLLLYEYDALQIKIDSIVGPHLFECIEDGLGFCYLPIQRIHSIKNYFASEAKNFPNHRNRLYCMAEMLEVPVAHLTERIVKPFRVITMDFNRIVEISNLLKSYGVSNNDILRDLWIFFHNISKSEERLREIIEAGCTRPRLWMCRCPDDVFEKTVKHYEDKKLILGSSMTVVDYLAEQLECPREEIESHCSTNSNLLRIRVSKIQSIMEMLLSEGITREAIRLSPRIFHHSEKKLKSRIHRLKELGYQPMSCPTLFSSNSKFETFCNNLKDNKHRIRMPKSSQDISANGIMDPWLKPIEKKLF